VGKELGRPAGREGWAEKQEHGGGELGQPTMADVATSSACEHPRARDRARRVKGRG
jgi:hypothetical protein